MPDDTIHWYPSKTDWWIAALLCLPPFAAVATLVGLLLGGSPSEWQWGIGGVLFVLGLYVGLVFPMRYGMDDSHLLVRCGLFRSRIPLGDISEVHPTHNPLSAPALSLDRLHVQYGPGIFKAVMISPADRDRFLDELAEKAGLVREGDRLRRG